MPAQSWSSLVETADVSLTTIDPRYPFWRREEIDEYEQALEVALDAVRSRYSVQRILECHADAEAIHAHYTGLYSDILSAQQQMSTHLRSAQAGRTREVPEESWRSVPLYTGQDDYFIDWSQPVILRGESRLGTYRYFYMYVPYNIGGKYLRYALHEEIGVQRGYRGLDGFKEQGKFFRMLPISGTVDGKEVSYLDRTVNMLLDYKNVKRVQERRVINTQTLCTAQCQAAKATSPCECVCGGPGHAGGETSLEDAIDVSTIYKNDLIIENNWRIMWRQYT